jgi:hypothetical protein
MTNDQLAAILTSEQTDVDVFIKIDGESYEMRVQTNDVPNAIYLIPTDMHEV